MPDRLIIEPFSLKETLECGQFFRFTKVGETYLVQASNHFFSLRQKGNALFYEGVDEPFLKHFFRLEEELEPMMREIGKDRMMRQAIETYRGLRLIRQDPWECLFSFICSSAKKVDHIRSMIESLCRCSGQKHQHGTVITYGFPEPLRIGDLPQLEEVRAGFRAPFLLKANQCLTRDQLLDLRKLPYREARQVLVSLPGVGPKIADCVLLYSLDFLEAFPMDTWIKRGLQAAYFKGRRTSEKKMETFVHTHFGPYAGYAQLYLYHYWRNHPVQRP